jgi:hypothetical protein
MIRARLEGMSPLSENAEANSYSRNIFANPTHSKSNKSRHRARKVFPIGKNSWCITPISKCYHVEIKPNTGNILSGIEL